MPMAQFLTPTAAPGRSSIVYPAFGWNGVQLRANLINLFSNNLQFYGKLFFYTLRDGALEWLDSEPHASITTWNDLARKFCNKYFSPAKVAQNEREGMKDEMMDVMDNIVGDEHAGTGVEGYYDKLFEAMHSELHLEVSSFLSLNFLVKLMHIKFMNK
ncbi:RING-H2 finger protein ATL63 [Abeliophyllum distichum]|uniref:RING-H2 finger protein ATL63 n=1 Tax=Abeliophyllum distichum TaxID=126358 RepID=A0ABD1NVV1_9LAMI